MTADEILRVAVECQLITNNVVNEVLAATSPRVGYLEIARAVERAHGINVPQARGEQE